MEGALRFLRTTSALGAFVGTVENCGSGKATHRTGVTEQEISMHTRRLHPLQHYSDHPAPHLQGVGTASQLAFQLQVAASALPTGRERRSFSDDT